MVSLRPIDLSQNIVPSTNNINASFIYKFSDMNNKSMLLKLASEANDNAYSFSGYELKNEDLDTTTIINFNERKYYFNRIIVSKSCDKFSANDNDYSLIIENIEHTNSDSYLFIIIPVKNGKTNNNTSSIKGVLPSASDIESLKESLEVPIISTQNIYLNTIIPNSEYYYYYMNNNIFISFDVPDKKIIKLNLDFFDNELSGNITSITRKEEDGKNIFYSNDYPVLKNPANYSKIQDDIYIDCSPEGDATTEIIKPRPIYSVMSFTDNSFIQLGKYSSQSYVIFTMLFISFIIIFITYKFISNINNINLLSGNLSNMNNNNKYNNTLTILLVLVTIVISTLYLVRRVLSNEIKSQMYIYENKVDIWLPILLLCYYIYKIYKKIEIMSENNIKNIVFIVFCTFFVILFLITTIGVLTTDNIEFTHFIIYTIYVTPMVSYLYLNFNLKEQDV